jgi:hypothetical protein
VVGGRGGRVVDLDAVEDGFGGGVGLGAEAFGVVVVALGVARYGEVALDAVQEVDAEVSDGGQVAVLADAGDDFIEDLAVVGLGEEYSSLMDPPGGVGDRLYEVAALLIEWLVGLVEGAEGLKVLLDDGFLRTHKGLQKNQGRMNFSPIPTDNLYKFCALTGAAGLFALLILLPQTLEKKWYESYYKTHRQIAAVEAEAKGVENLIGTLQEIVNNATESPQTNPKPRFQISYSNEDIKLMMQKTDEAIIKRDVLFAEAKVMAEELKTMGSQIDRARISAYLGIALCVGLIAWGLPKWNRVQLLLDARLQKEAEQAPKETPVTKTDTESAVISETPPKDHKPQKP